MDDNKRIARVMSYVTPLGYEAALALLEAETKMLEQANPGGLNIVSEIADRFTRNEVIGLYERDAELILAPALGYPLFELGSPGYSEGRLSYNVGDHTAQSLMAEAAKKLDGYGYSQTLNVLQKEESSLDENTVHTYPVNDLIEHRLTGTGCQCKPSVEAVFRLDGSNGWQVIHNALDGREDVEEQ